jgi:RNA polymerase sigma-70 factor (ECF subfamily)
MEFNLYVFKGYNHREVPSVLKISEGMSKPNLFDATQILKTILP